MYLNQHKRIRHILINVMDISIITMMFSIFMNILMIIEMDQRYLVYSCILKFIKGILPISIPNVTCNSLNSKGLQCQVFIKKSNNLDGCNGMLKIEYFAMCSNLCRTALSSYFLCDK
eukprot:7067_1